MRYIPFLRQQPNLPKKRYGMWERLYQVGPFKLLVVRPNPLQLGHVAFEIKFAISTAKRLGAWYYLVRSPDCVNPAMYEIITPNIRRLPSSRLLDWWFLRLANREFARHEQMEADTKRRHAIGVPPDSWLVELEFNLRASLIAWKWLLQKQFLRLLTLRPFDILAGGGRRLASLCSGIRLDAAKAARKRRKKLKKLIKECSRRHHIATERKKRLNLPIDGFWTLPFHRWQQGRNVARHPIHPPGDRIYMKRELLADWTVAALPAAMRSRCAAKAERLGIPPNARIVTVHAREAGYKRGREVQDKQKRAAPGNLGAKPIIRDDSTRNTEIATYLPALEWLVSKGFVVVRLGDTSMSPVSLLGVLDLARHPERSPEMDLYFIEQSYFMLGTDSGPAILAYLFGCPLLYSNATHPALCWPFHERDLVVPKYIRRRSDAAFLSIEDTLTPEMAENMRNTAIYEYLDLTAEDLLQSAIEMLELLETDPLPEPTAEQERLKSEAANFLEAQQAHRYIEKWGCRNGFIGNGRIARFVAERNQSGTWAPASHTSTAAIPCTRGRDVHSVPAMANRSSQ